jgi:hypothetical protein
VPNFLIATAASAPVDVKLAAIIAMVDKHMGHIVFS